MNEIRIFDSEGAFVDVVGRSGEGPGEYRQLRNVFVLPGDTLAALDAVGRRVTWLDERRQVISTEATTGNRRFPGSAFLLARDAMFGLETQWAPSIGEGTHVAEAYLVRLDLSDGSFDTLTLDGYRWQITGEWWASAPYTTAPILHAEGDRVFVASTGEYAIYEYDAAGVLQRVMRVEMDARPVTDDIRDAWCEDSRNEGRCRGERFPPDYPEVLPRIDKLVATRDGTVWARLFPDPLEASDENRWHVFGPTGKVVAVAVTPKALRVTQIAGDRVIGIWTNELDVQSVRAYRLDRS